MSEMAYTVLSFLDPIARNNVFAENSKKINVFAKKSTFSQKPLQKSLFFENNQYFRRIQNIRKVMEDLPKNARPIGYQALVERYKLQTLPHFRSSYITIKGGKSLIKKDDHEVYIYPKGYALKNEKDPLLQLEFALKYDGINLEILKGVFQHIEKKDLIQFIIEHPLGGQTRKLWYLYEQLTHTQLPIQDIQKGSYVELLDDTTYYTAKPIKSRRHRVIDNLPGNFQFCPFIRKTSALAKFEKKRLDKVAKTLIKKYDDYTIQRATQYLYTKETMSSWEIERDRPTKQRLARFIEILKDVKSFKALSEKNLIQLQNSIVDSRFAEQKVRTFQNYVGTALDFHREKIHYICPKPIDVSSMMSGLIYCFDRMCESSIHPVIIAAAISFGFVFIHPFEDGNGRIHRFLIHYILSKLGFTPEGIIFPVSATMLKEMKHYDAALESISSPMLTLLDFDLNSKREVTVHGETDALYRYLDYTRLAAFLFDCVEKTIHTDFKEELDYIANYDHAKKELQEIVDMPDKKIDLLIQCIIQNKGTLSRDKRKSHFHMLTNEECEAIEKVVRNCFQTLF